jgi:hypothetical protein
MHCFGYSLMTSTVSVELDPVTYMECIPLPFLNRVWHVTSCSSPWFGSCATVVFCSQNTNLVDDSVGIAHSSYFAHTLELLRGENRLQTVFQHLDNMINCVNNHFRHLQHKEGELKSVFSKLLPEVHLKKEKPYPKFLIQVSDNPDYLSYTSCRADSVCRVPSVFLNIFK